MIKNIKMNIENKFFLREEQNGLTIYERKKYLYNFYEGIFIKNIQNEVVPLNAEEFSKYILEKKDKISLNIDSKYPFNINWLIEDKCNLDCIYCFADDKFYIKKDENILATAHHIMELNPLTVGLSGGEPTLNPLLPKILKLFCGKVAITIDTNGTTKNIIDLIPLLKSAHAMVRITIDTVDNELLNKLRPPKAMPINGFNQVGILKKNIKALIDADINVMVHTVLTRENIDKMADVAEALIQLGIKRWHLYGVNYCEKCKDYFEEIRVYKEEVIKNKDFLLKHYGDKMIITHSIEEDYSANAVILVDSNGKFFVDTIINGIRYIGKNPESPNIDEVLECLDYKRHKEGYLSVNDK